MTEFDKRALHVQYGVKSGNPVIDVGLVLNSCGLGKYGPYFKKAGFDAIESYKRKNDEDIEAILLAVEKANNVKLPRSHRVKLWKTFRYRWFGNPGNARDFVTRQQVPRIILPKKDWKFYDAQVDFKNLDPERQRMIRRTKQTDEVQGTRWAQFEVFYREPAEFYELVGLQRCLNEWRATDPRKMILDDPREEVFFAQLQSLETRLVFRIDVLNKALRTRLKFFLLICLIGALNLAYACILIYLSIDRAFKLDPGLLLRHCFSSYQMQAAMGPLIASVFAFDVARRDVNTAVWLERYQRMHDALRILRGDLVVFRMDSSTKRSADLTDEVSLDRKLRKINVDEVEDMRTFETWMARKMTQGVEDVDTMTRSLNESRSVVPDQVPQTFGRLRRPPSSISDDST